MCVAAGGMWQHWALEMDGPWALQPPFLLPPCLHLHSILFVFYTVKNSVSIFKTQCHHLQPHGVKQKQE